MWLLYGYYEHYQSINQSIKSALTDHATQDNHVINWSQPTVIDREPERFTRWIKEAIHIRKEGQQAMNRDEGSYQLSHATSLRNSDGSPTVGAVNTGRVQNRT